RWNVLVGDDDLVGIAAPVGLPQGVQCLPAGCAAAIPQTPAHELFVNHATVDTVVDDDEGAHAPEGSRHRGDGLEMVPEWQSQPELECRSLPFLALDMDRSAHQFDQAPG